MGNVETYQYQYSVESGSGVSIGKEVFPIARLTRWEPGVTELRFFNATHSFGDRSDRLRSILQNNLTNNSPTSLSEIAHERGRSAYYTYDPQSETIIIEWGEIDPTNGEAKLHNYLHQSIDYHQRVAKGMKLSSGHIARVRGENYFLALMDQLAEPDLAMKRDSPLGKMINTLYHNCYLPITSLGFVQTPAFIL